MTNYIRIDDRLIHGQIIANWAGNLNIDNIVAIDKATAENPSLQSIMKFSVPKKYTTHICTMSDGIEIINDLTKKDENTLIILRYPYLLDELLPNIDNVESVNIGNVSKQDEHSIQIKSNVYLTKEDIKTINQINEKKIDLLFKTLPDSKGIDWNKKRDQI